MAAATLVLGLSSCTKEKGAETSSADTYKVTLSFKNAETRADGAAAVQGTKVIINSGYICFVSANDAITDVYTISDDPTGGKNIKNSDLGSTAVNLNNVPGTSTKVYMIANKGTIANLPTPVVGNTMTDYMKNNMDVRDQSDYTKVTSIDNASLQDSGTPGVKNAALTLSTKVARIQIKGITFEGNVTGKVAGIFINGYYSTMQLNGTGGTLKGSTIGTDYDEDGAGSVFPSELGSYVFDKVDKPIAATVKPTTTDGVWGYNLFVSATPQIIIKLSNVFVDGHELTDPLFITINGFKNGGTAITNLAGGMIYTINTESLILKYEDMSTEPGTTPFQVDVTVTTVEWQETVVTPNI